MIDLEKEREAFEAWFKSLNENGRTTYFLGQESKVAWEAWQAAKAQAIPDGFVVVPKEPTQKMIDAFPEVEYEDTYAGACSIWVDDNTLKIGYKAMIEAQEQAND